MMVVVPVIEIRQCSLKARAGDACIYTRCLVSTLCTLWPGVPILSYPEGDAIGVETIAAGVSVETAKIRGNLQTRMTCII